ncbi:phosphatase PAP2 family protein [Streptomyces sp. PsTaAH-124]|uniref:phosphatase PAP2 family protein n=1 Tax=Streptomyces sp. PsTaAH-124 TaxID=1157638 RepID=UPI00036C714C|nr:phosphatase PAP2 family protein [Streptomyces sp. PsTaAH-124]
MTAAPGGAARTAALDALCLGLLTAAVRDERLAGWEDRWAPAPVRGGRAVRAWRAVGAAGSAPVAWTVVAVRCALPPHRRGPGGRLAPAAVLAAAGTGRRLLSRAVDRPRPPAEERRTRVHGASFPSRHTMTALVAWALALEDRRAATGICCAVAAARLALRAHRPADVLGGWLFGRTCLALADLARRAQRADRARLRTRRPGPGAWGPPWR